MGVDLRFVVVVVVVVGKRKARRWSSTSKVLFLDQAQRVYAAGGDDFLCFPLRAMPSAHAVGDGVEGSCVTGKLSLEENPWQRLWVEGIKAQLDFCSYQRGAHLEEATAEAHGAVLADP